MSDDLALYRTNLKSIRGKGRIHRANAKDVPLCGQTVPGHFKDCNLWEKSEHPYSKFAVSVRCKRCEAEVDPYRSANYV